MSETATAEIHASGAALHMQKIVVDVRKDAHTITAEAFCDRSIGITFCRHGRAGDDPDRLVTDLIDTVEKLGISAETYRIVREDLPPQTVIEHRYPAGSGVPPVRPSVTRSSKCSPGEKCEGCGHPLYGGGCEEEDFAEEGESCGCLYCLCMNETEFGETCSECQAGAHQG